MRSFSVTTTAGARSETHRFGFTACVLTVRCDGPAGVRLRLDEEPASAADFLLAPGEQLNLDRGPSVDAVGLLSTGRTAVRVGAWE